MAWLRRPHSMQPLFGFAILSSLWIVVGLFALVGRRRVTKWGSFILGGFLVAISTAGGVFDGIRDGLHIAATVLLAVTLPGFFAIRASWRLLRLPGTPNGVLTASVPEGETKRFVVTCGSK